MRKGKEPTIRDRTLENKGSQRYTEGMKKSPSLHRFITLLLAAASIFLFFSCSKQDNKDVATAEMMTIRADAPDTHKWYYLTKDGYTETKHPSQAPKAVSKLWTDAVRLSSAAQKDGSAFFLINTKGLLIVDGSGKLTVKTDLKLFPEKTAGNLVIAGKNPIFHLYENTVLELEADPESINTQRLEDIPFLAMYNTENGTFFPGPDRNTFKFAETSEVTQVYFDGEEIYLSVKNSTEKKNDFSYYRMKMPDQLADFILSSRNRSSSSYNLEEIDEDAFEEKLTPQPFIGAPERLRKLLDVIPEDFPFSVTLTGSAVENETPRTWINNDSPEALLETGIYTQTANAIIENDYIMALFPDGTGYFSGCLPGKHIMNKGKPFCFILPELPQDFVYGVIALSGTTLTAAWEENSFYETGRAGFIVIDLGSVFYDA
ncbi:MAG: hypothetical protein K5930_05695 [Treponemataceae bacterium]|nr:hypothetical protein [Treponemataceae bacterium]